MSLAQRVTSSVNRAFVALDDLKGDMIIKTVEANPAYDAALGTLEKIEKSYTVEAVFDSFETDRVDGTIIQKEDRKILVKPVTTFTPKIGDTITDGDNVLYEIMDVETVKAYGVAFLWELQARK